MALRKADEITKKYVYMDKEQRESELEKFLKPGIISDEFKPGAGSLWFVGLVVGVYVANDDRHLFICPYDPCTLDGLFSENGKGIHYKTQDSTIRNADWVVCRYEYPNENDIKNARKAIEDDPIYNNPRNVPIKIPNKYKVHKIDYDKVKEVSEKYCKVISELQKNQDKLNSLLEEIEAKKSRCLEVETNLEDLKKIIEKAEKEKSILNMEIDTMEKLGMRYGGKRKDGQSEDAVWDFPRFYGELKGELDDKNPVGLNLAHYNTHGTRVLKRFLSAAFTGQLIILTGPSGNGKTKLPEIVASRLNEKGLARAEYRLIPVQPDWTDHQDLFGFYHFVDHRYISTEFLDALIEAKNKPDTFFFIVLDEMNLARVEYYFARFLSEMEENDDNGKKGIIRLYSDSVIRERNIAFAKRLRRICRNNSDLTDVQKRAVESIGKDGSDDDIRNSIDTFIKDLKTGDERYVEWFEEYEDFITQAEVFPPSFEFPSNIQIVGTINMDETTKGISPKVLDRSYVIELCDIKSTDVDDNTPEDTDITDIYEFMREVVEDANEGSEVVSFRYSPRSENHLRRIVEHIGESNDDYPNCQIADDFMLGKILPGIRCASSSIEESDHNKLIEHLRPNYESKLPAGIAKLDRMYNKDLRTYDYWE